MYFRIYILNVDYIKNEDRFKNSRAGIASIFRR